MFVQILLKGWEKVERTQQSNIVTYLNSTTQTWQKQERVAIIQAISSIITPQSKYEMRYIDFSISSDGFNLCTPLSVNLLSCILF